VERRHAGAWIERLHAAGVAVPSFRPSWRTQTPIWLARRFGPAVVVPTLATLEELNSHEYRRQAGQATAAPEAAAMGVDERSHARLLRQIAQTTPGGIEGGVLGQLEGRHRAAGGNALRAAVLGANDGLMSNLSLVMGVAGAAPAGSTILLTGLAGPLAIAASALLSAAGLFVIGAGITLSTGRSVFFSGARQVHFGLAAAGLTYGIGRVIGESLAG
jgi:hypothetical protein